MDSTDIRTVLSCSPRSVEMTALSNSIKPASNVMLRVTTRSSSTTTSVRYGLNSTEDTTRVYVPAGTLDKL